MICGIGLDIVERDRMLQKIADQRFVARILVPEEQKIFNQLSPKRKTEFLAGRFSAKEAYAKAKGTGIGASLSFQDICIIDDPAGKPVLTSRLDHGEYTHVSITHTRESAAAVVVIESLSGQSAY
ncbi:holo-ACP synthase [Sporolactobacillus spathodeae]|uniref:Holo-[acyl-carrier-protein] synthase n=1 Tax=Sporolactobacillus spathodeae TaxID=1465502 RepID=A0ABS2QCR6_9BACL|nr:holo-[acyl-carrier protein] synthase [Sporolactobacillus spathodeae]